MYNLAHPEDRWWNGCTMALAFQQGKKHCLNGVHTYLCCCAKTLILYTVVLLSEFGECLIHR